MRSRRGTYGLAMLTAAAMLAGCAAGGGGAGSRAGGGTEASGSAQSVGEDAAGASTAGGSSLETGGSAETEAAPDLWKLHTTEELMAVDYLLYRVNCGAAEDAGGETGLYQTAADQPYGADAGTGKQWGYRPADGMEAGP